MGSYLLIALVISAWSSAAADKLRVSYASVTGNTAGITYIAQRAGLFEKQGLDVEIILITGGPASISALLNGDVDLDMRAPIAAMQAMAHGVKLTFLLFNRTRLNTTWSRGRKLKTSSSSKAKRSASSALAAFRN